MISIQFSKKIVHGLLAVGALCIAFTLTASGQVQTSTSTAPTGGPTKSIKVERGEIVYVSGNSLVVKMEDGTMRHFDNVPETTTITVDGKQLNVHQLQPGMKVERQTITTTTPRMITTVQTVTGTVWQVHPPNMVILRLEDGTNQQFKIPKGQKFTINGQEMDAFGLRKGMKVDAQKVVEEPETVVTQQIKRTGTAPPPPPAPKPDVPMLVASEPPTPAPVETAAAEPAPTKLPKTASDLPLIGLLGLLFCGISLSVTAIRGTLARIG
jgi:RNase P/RNase MRP subunit p29